LGSDAFFALAVVWVGGWLLASILVRRARGKVSFAPTSESFRFSEKWASGRSLDTWWSKLGGARNCLFVAVGNDKLSIQPHFPFSLGFLPEIYGLEQEIPLSRVVRVTKRKTLFQSIITVEYFDEIRKLRSFELRLRNADGFLNVVQGHAAVAP
jgi:hypothetical protein